MRVAKATTAIYGNAEAQQQSTDRCHWHTQDGKPKNKTKTAKVKTFQALPIKFKNRE